ncbi:MAG TPA: YncE family protein [Candidatus Acidoferrum sp.]|nr:YncE family protein [Candidatus Acidoferrum sp.]
MSPKRVLSSLAIAVTVAVFIAITFLAAPLRSQSHSPALLVLEKADHKLAIVDPIKLTVTARVPAGPDPHEVAVSSDGKLAYISNYGGTDSDLHTISVVDLAARKALQPIDISPLHSAHGLDFVGGKLYFTAETNKVIGRYDPATRRVDWILGTGQDRTHMVWVAPSLDRIFTSNVNSGTISIIEYVTPPSPGFTPPGGLRKTWEVTDVRSGRGSEGFDVSPDGKEIWAANAQDATVTIIDVARQKAKQTFAIPVQGANRLKFTLDGKYVLVSGLGGPRLQGQNSAPNLVVIDAANRKEVKRLSLGGGAAGILMQPGGSRAYVAVSGANKVAVIDLNTFQIAGEIATGRGPDGMAWVGRGSD